CQRATLSGASKAMLATLLTPVSASLWTATPHGERQPPNQFLGMAVIASGLIAIDGRRMRRLRRSNDFA
ncbi:hypothetical protein J8J20_21045, partial [Mycobacterium tuberculosis]|nr:hypothetical protein [Mycobacterium tuberculosis]